MAFLLGLDLGTTGVKALLMSIEGKVIFTSFEEYPLLTPEVNWAEQNPSDWWQATVKSIQQLIQKTGIKSEKIIGIGLSGQMHGLVLLDKNHKVLRPAILWCDQRTQRECDYITSKIGKKRLIELTSNPALTGFTAGKLLWVRENEPRVYEELYKILLPKDYIRFRLTGEFATEVSDASGTLFLDVKNRKWSKELLSELDIDMNFLPECYESSVVSGEISPEASKLTGLKEGTPVVGGAGDQAAQAIGSGVIKEGVLSATIGTSGVVFASSGKPRIDPLNRLQTFCHAVPNKWHLMGVMLSAGGSLRWLRDTLCKEEKKKAKQEDKDPYDIMTEEASDVPPGSGGLIFLPYLTGERTPYPDPMAKGVFFGLTLRHSKSHLIRAVLEGVAYGLRDSLEIIKDLKIPIEEIRCSGGGNCSSLWRQIQADINNSEMVTVNVNEGAAFGSALLAGVGTSVYDNVEEACKQTIKIVTTTRPQEENVRIYNKYYEIYHSLYPILKERFASLSDLIGRRG